MVVRFHYPAHMKLKESYGATPKLCAVLLGLTPGPMPATFQAGRPSGCRVPTMGRPGPWAYGPGARARSGSGGGKTVKVG